MTSVVQALWLAAALLGGTAGAAAASRPLHLVSEATGTGIRLRVVGQSAVACEASYTLEISNRSRAGSSRSVQRGIARLKPGAAPVDIATSTLGGAAAAGWTSRLSVGRCGASPQYEEVAGAQR